MKRFTKKMLLFICVLSLAMSMSIPAFAHCPTDPNNCNNFIPVGTDSPSGWWRGFIFENNLYLPNDGPLFLGQADNELNWRLTQNGRLSISAVFTTNSNYRLLVTSPDYMRAYYDNTFSNVSSVYANVFNLSPGEYRILVFDTNNNAMYGLYQYTIWGAYN